MNLNPSTINRFLLFKLPSAWLCGVRLQTIDDTSCTVTVKHRWINQNPFGSMYFAVQAMAAELSTGALVLRTIRENGDVSMLVASCRADFSKKALGKITFHCHDGMLIKEVVKQAIATGEAKIVTLQSAGIDQAGETVSRMQFEWTLKPRNKR